MNVITAKQISKAATEKKHMTFVIDADNNITAYTDVTAPEGAELKLNELSFATEKELASLAGSWSGVRLIEIWNSLPGATPVKKFTDRQTAVARIWKAIQSLVPTSAEGPVEAPAAETKKARKTPKATGESAAAKIAKQKPVKARKAKKEHKPATAREGSKKAVILALLQKQGGATLAEIMTATGWQAHSVRGFISGMLGKKMAMTVESARNECGERTYRVAR